jgi:anti-sigma B factor antagonist
VAIEFSAWDEQVDARTRVVAVRGEIDLFTAPEFKQRVNAAVESGAELIMVDLREAGFIDSSSLGILISAHKRLKLREGVLAVVCDVPAILNTFAITGLDGVLIVVPTREAAVAAAQPDGDAEPSAAA